MVQKQNYKEQNIPPVGIEKQIISNYFWSLLSVCWNSHPCYPRHISSGTAAVNTETRFFLRLDPFETSVSLLNDYSLQSTKVHILFVACSHASGTSFRESVACAMELGQFFLSAPEVLTRNLIEGWMPNQNNFQQKLRLWCPKSF